MYICVCISRPENLKILSESLAVCGRPAAAAAAGSDDSDEAAPNQADQAPVECRVRVSSQKRRKVTRKLEFFRLEIIESPV